MTMTKKLLFLISLLVVSQTVFANKKISEIEFVESPLSDVVRTLSELTDSNVIATADATKAVVTIHLKNVSIESAIKSISRINDLWYRYDDDTNTYRIMTREEYSNDLVVNESEHIEVFTLKNANVSIVAQAINDLFEGRVKLTLGIEAGRNSVQSGGSNQSSSKSNNNRNNSNSSNNSNNSGGGSGSTGQTVTTGSKLPTDLTLQQLEQLASSGALNTQRVQEVTLQSQPIYITLNNEHNMMIVRTDDQKIINIIKNLIHKMDLAIPQVMLEMKILSINLGEDFNSIFNFKLQPSGTNQSSTPIQLGNNALPNSGSFIYEFLNSRLTANIEFLEKNNRLKVLSNPMVVASNHRQTELFIGEEALLTRGFSYNAAVIQNGTVVSQAYIQAETELRDVGITLRLTPRINADNTVTIDLEQENSTIKTGGASLPVVTDTGTTTLAIDTVDTSRLNGVIVAKDNLTVAVGGLIRSTKSTNQQKVPLLSEIPIIGRVFRSDIETEEDTETVLLITPRIMKNPSDSEKIRVANNPYYDSYNNNFPYPEEYPNRFIEPRSKAEQRQPITNKKSQPYPSQYEEVRVVEPTQKQAHVEESYQRPVSRHKLYMEMSQYAAELVRVASKQRSTTSPYQTVRIANEHKPLFADSRIRAIPEFSLNRGGLYITAVRLTNISTDTLPVDYQNVTGSWLASSIELSTLSSRNRSKNSTYLYLISSLPFDQALMN
jgi:general secretion pathway protein D